MSSIRWFLVTNLCLLVSVGANYYGLPAVGWFALLVAFICLQGMLFFAWGSWITISALFGFFFLLYTLSGPYEILFGSGEIPPFSPPFYVQQWLTDASFAVMGICWGAICVRLSRRLIPAGSELRPRLHLGTCAILLMAAATLSEMVNMARAGGPSVLLAGKAIYQAQTADIQLTLPSATVALVAFSFWGLYYASALRRPRIASAGFVVLAMPLLGIHLLLGQRLEIASYLFAFLLGFTYRKPLTRFPWKLALLGAGLYLAMAPLYGFRWVFPLIISGQRVDIERSSARQLLFSSLNPAVNEFGGAFGNYSIFLQTGEQELLYGKSYLTGLLGIVPGFLFPGEKPKSITYEFRDRFFPEQAQRSRIAGTAFSSLLEARMNFGTSGVFFVFSLWGALLAFVEKLRQETQSVWYAVFYSTLAQLAMIFHRSSAGGLIGGYLWIAVVIGMTWMGRLIWRHIRGMKRTATVSSISSPA
ncbi:MAG: hypothetical protein WHX60_12285 [Armatimonadota bacterium]